MRSVRSLARSLVCASPEASSSHITSHTQHHCVGSIKMLQPHRASPRPVVDPSITGKSNFSTSLRPFPSQTWTNKQATRRASLAPLCHPFISHDRATEPGWFQSSGGPAVVPCIEVPDPCCRLHNPIPTSSSQVEAGLLRDSCGSRHCPTGYENHGSLALLAVGYRKQRWPILVATTPVSLSRVSTAL